jgi:hypothetical protein
VAAGPYELGPVHAKLKAGDERAAFQVVTAEIAQPEVARDALAWTICATVWAVIEAVPIRGRGGALPAARPRLDAMALAVGQRAVAASVWSPLVCGWVS